MFVDERNLFLCTKFRNRLNIMKLCNLMNSQHFSETYNLCKFIRIINKKLNSPGDKDK